MMQDKNTKVLLVSLLTLITIGLVMVYSSSYIYASENFGSSLHFIKKQLIYLSIGVFLFLFLSKTKITFWYNKSLFFHAIVGVLILVCFTPLGITLKGASRWINVMGFNLQPAEFIKITTLLSSLYLFENFSKWDIQTKIQNLLILLVPPVLVLIQPDFGIFLISFLVILFAAFFSRMKKIYFIYFFSTIVISGSIILISAPYRMKRLLTFLDPWSDPQNSGFQIIQSYLAFANGHLFGQGIGNSTEKLFYLPEAYNDFILSVIGEELGFLGIVVLVLLYLVFIYSGFKVALTQKNEEHTKIMLGIISLLGIQVFLNMGVVLGLLPTKGLNLPFISYGGSSLVSNLASMGIYFAALNMKSVIGKR